MGQDARDSELKGGKALSGGASPGGVSLSAGKELQLLRCIAELGPGIEVICCGVRFLFARCSCDSGLKYQWQMARLGTQEDLPVI